MVISSDGPVSDATLAAHRELIAARWENATLRKYILHLETCDICNEGIKYGMCEEKYKLRREAGFKDEG